MSSLTGYAEAPLPTKLLLNTVSLLGLLCSLILALLCHLGLFDNLVLDLDWAPLPRPSLYPTRLIKEMLPAVVKFSDMAAADGGCAVCLCEFEAEDEIRRLTNCEHIFHRSCLDRWIDHDRTTCPLCRVAFVPEEMMTEAFYLWEALR